MQTECVLLQIGDDAEVGVLIPSYDAEHLGAVIASAAVIRLSDREILDTQVILKSFNYVIEQDD